MTVHLNRRKVIIACAAAVFALFTFLAYASAETLELTLDEAINLGLQNSLGVKAKELAFHSSQKDVKSAKAAYYPGISLSSSYSHRFTKESAAGAASDSDQLGLAIDLSQTIYAFGKLNASAEAAAKKNDNVKIDLNEEKRSLAVEIQRAFYGYILAREVLKVREETLKYKEEALEVARTRYEAGLTTKREVLKAESDLKSFVPELLAARNDVEYAILSLRDIVGIESEVDIEIEGELDIPSIKLEIDSLIQKALSENSSIKQAEMNIAIQKIQGKLDKSERFPVISSFANAGLQNGFNLGTGDARLAGDNKWDSTVSAGVSIQLGLSSLFPWSKETSAVQKSGIELERMSTELKALQKSVSLTIDSLFLDLSKERAKIDAGKKALELAEELFLSSKEMYENGLISSLEYEDSQIGLMDGRVSYLTYIYDYRMSLCDLMDAVGTDRM